MANEEQEKITCHGCWQYGDFCKECESGWCSWFTAQKSPGCAQDCDHYNHHGEPRKHRDENAEIFPKVKELYEFMRTGKSPGETSGLQPMNLTAKQAFDIIWLLQEQLHILPDSFERCDGCDDLFDSDCEGYRLDDQFELDGKTLPEKYWGNYCENCVPDVELILAREGEPMSETKII